MSARLSSWSRWVLLGADDSWGARLATGRTAIYVLAALVIILHALDLATGLRMMLSYGIHLEQNPLARYIMTSSGPLGLIYVKLGVVLAGVLLFVRTAQLGRARLARNCLLFAASVGMLGAASNLVG
jgi:hypothetical protein